MKVKEIDRTANIAWSPATQHPIYLAAGTAAQQLDASFSTTAALEVYALNLTEPGLDMSMKGSVVSDYRFHALSWGGGGVIVGGADGGNLLMYDASKLLKGEDPLLHHSTKHTGPVHSLDFNNFQECLLASGASDSEIFIWDLNNPNSPVTLGAKSQPLEEVCCVSWNCQVQHILASAFPARCVVWDLRKNEPVIKVADTASRLRCKVVCWHPEVATQLCLASEDDMSPLIQLWDLRFATSPLKTLQQHQRGVLSVAWCPQDPDLLLSCGKDNRILCWNPNSNVPHGEVVCELCSGCQWSFDVAWCPRNPALIASASCDGLVSVFSLMGGQQQTQPSSKIAESFPGSESLGAPESLERTITVPLQRPPKWLRKPAGAAFAFGGRLVSLAEGGKTVTISQVVSEPQLVERAQQLEAALSQNTLQEFCGLRGEADNASQMTWRFLQATFNPSARSQMLTLLGYNFETVTAEVNAALKSDENVDSLSEDLNLLSTGTGDVPALEEGDLAIHAGSDDPDGLVCRALLTGNLSGAVDLCVDEGRWADALVLAQAAGQELLLRTQKRYFASVRTKASKLISSVVTGDWETMVQHCDIRCWKEVFAAILTYAKPDQFTPLCESLGRRLEADASLSENASLCYIGAFNLELLAQWWSRRNANPDSHSLQGLVEQIMVLRSAGGAAPLESGGVLAELLAKYSHLLAAQGSLQSAANYLLDPNELSLSILRDRIYQSLGQRSPAFPFQRVDVRRTQTPSRHPSSAGLQQQQYTSNYPDGNTPLSHSEPPQSKDLRQSTGHLSQRYPKHLHDPSVYSEYPQSQFYQQPSFQQQPFYEPGVPSSQPSPAFQPPISTFQPPPSTFQPPPPPLQQPNTFQPQPIQQPSTFQPATIQQPSTFQQPTSIFQQQTSNFHQPTSVYQPAPPAFQQPSSTFQPPQMQQQQAPAFQPPPSSTFQPPPSSTFQPPPSSTFQPPPSSTFQPPPSSTFQPPPSSTFHSSPPPTFQPSSSFPSTLSYNEVKPGWNDPPLIKRSSLKPTPPRSQPDPPPEYFVPAPPSSPPPPMTAQAPPQKVQEAPREKGPIPPEHQVLQDTLEDLRRQCQRVATNPQTKRKLDDVAKKLENLYDRLRDSSVSQGVLSGLHQLVQCTLQGDYPSALAVHGQTVATANFTETSGFMPSIKVLLQTASQLTVSLR